MHYQEDGAEGVRVTDAAQDFVENTRPAAEEPTEPAETPDKASTNEAGDSGEAGGAGGAGETEGAGEPVRRTRGKGTGGKAAGGRGRSGGKNSKKDEGGDDARGRGTGGGRGGSRSGSSGGGGAGTGGKATGVKEELVINYVPGEECRVAVLRDSRLEEFHAERVESASHVGNIYVGRVANVEPQIQAAFIDFGLEHNGFLHISDLHPRYFPGEDGEATERVGKKTPRRDRPPIQECLRRGQEVAVQVLKEGVGTKGPTVTSYLSVPGRFLVMMPQMDKVGVSRKVEDEETRRKMREILDQLELPEGFGFIVRTAGMDRNKTELKRDLAYLQRLWKDIEKRWKANTGKPRLLYSESDLLVRTLRDILTSDMQRVVVDNELALARAARFLKIVSPRSTTSLVHYTGKTPIYHALGVEEQIQRIHAREVPLPSGGRLVIDETEALVAIDVNSGKSRDARDAETNAFRTNLEAADEICRQLRLRDLGGIVINDLIDMRSLKHRREVEGRFRENLKRDRARSSITAISQFGILEMTRQRMRGSHESIHFAGCQTCRGRGLVQRPDSVASDALRDMAAILDHDRVSRVEMVVNPRIAGELLSGKRRSLSRLERAMNKRVDVRVSEAVPIDRVTFYAYDERGADVDVAKLSVRKASADQLVAVEVAGDVDNWADQPEGGVIEEDAPAEAVEMAEDLHPIELDEDETEASADGWGSVPEADRGRGRGRGRRGGRDGGERGGRGGRGDRSERNERGGERGGERGRGGEKDGRRSAPVEAAGAHAEADAAGEGGEEGDGGEGGGRRRRRRRRRGGRGRGRGREGGEGIAPGEAHDEGDEHEPSAAETHEQDDEHEDHADAEHAEGGEHGGEGGGDGEAHDGEAGGRRRRRRRRGGRGRSRREGEPGGGGEEGRGGGEPRDNGTHDAPAPTRRSEPPRKSEPARGEPRGGGASAKADKPAPEQAKTPGKAAPRSLYGFRRKLGPGQRPAGGREE